MMPHPEESPAVIDIPPTSNCEISIVWDFDRLDQYTFAKLHGEIPLTYGEVGAFEKTSCDLPLLGEEPVNPSPTLHPDYILDDVRLNSSRSTVGGRSSAYGMARTQNSD